MLYRLDINLLVFYRLNRDIRFVVSFLGELNHSGHCGKQGMVSSNTNIVAGMVNSSTLSDEDITGFYDLSAVKLHTQSFTF